MNRREVEPKASGKEKTMQGNKVALVTGANKGLGFEIARQLGQQGDKGAKSAVALALLPDDGPTGEFFHMGEALPW